MYKIILLPVDLNEEGFSHIAAEHACALAKMSGATIHLLNVLPTSQLPMVSAHFPTSVLQEIRKSAHASLKDFAEKHIDDGIATQIHMMEGKPSKEIIKAANKYNADLIVMPSHKRAKLELAVIGSVAAKVVSSASINVMVVKPQ
ncbi:universal stress protein [Moritella sp. 24]|uniref:universal stress protein n=1 Tax=Moritella sp. 24 TaxID=2746230 RepID=UPI001BAD1BB9|nr:universal stress protein [Moritella sp. 24]QUM75902.1 universal stress protein [Moritella sp. 24]